MAGWEAVVVDNSGMGIVHRTLHCESGRVKVIENESNIGFGGAINRVLVESTAPFLAVLNDDAAPCPSWLCNLLTAIEAVPDAGMCASRVLLAEQKTLDSAGMLICADGSSKQRGHGGPPDVFAKADETLFASGSAALYRRQMLEEIGGFDESFFLYCEDTDVGLRARWAGWRCLYAPGAVVEHRYSQTAGAASDLKAYYAERNRILVLLKCFPVAMLLAAPFVTLARYFWSIAALWDGSGKAGEYREQGGGLLNLAGIVARAHFAAMVRLPRLIRQRRAILRGARITAAEFRKQLAAHTISAREVARL